MKKIFIAVLLAYSCVFVNAQESDKISLHAEIRTDYQRESIDKETVNSGTGFKGKYINLRLDGNIGKHFSYSWKQRMNRLNSVSSFFSSTDWAYLSFNANENWAISAGKQVVGIGGYEYDRSPINVYTASEFWNNIACYQLGVSTSYRFNKGKDMVMIQTCQSPFRIEEGDDIYAYNLMWYGSHDWFNTIYSINMIEYQKGNYINYITLGNHFKFNKVDIYIDLMNRASAAQKNFFSNHSVIAEVAYSINGHINLFGKFIRDVNNSDVAADLLVLPGTEINTYGAGVEFFPIKDKKNIRLHANYFYARGRNSNPHGILANNQSIIDLGVTWNIEIL